MKKHFKTPVAVLLSCLLALGCVVGLSACSGGGGSASVDKVYTRKISGFEFNWEGQEISQYTTESLTLFTDGTYEYTYSMTLGTTGIGTGGYFTNVSFGTFTSVAEDPNDEENTIYILTLETPTRIIHQDAYSWGTQVYIDTDDTGTYPENEAGDIMRSFDEVVEYIRSGMPNNYIGGNRTYSMTVTVDDENGEIEEVVENTPEQPAA